jgi:Cu+-exporting ATPase
VPVDGIARSQLVGLAAGLQQGSEHPLAGAIVAAAKARGFTLPSDVTFESDTGRGVRGRVGAADVVLGNAAIMRAAGVDVTRADLRVSALRAHARTVLFMALNGRLAAVFAIADPIKAGAREAIGALRAQGLRIVLLTGDARETALAVGAELGFSPADIHAEVLPAQKRDVVRELQDKGAVVAMAGDGINDAPALAEASVGIAMGTGTDVAMQSAGITLVKGDLSALVRARRLSRATMRNIRQNLALAFGYNAIGVPVAAGVLYPVAGILVSPIWASAAMTFSSVSVIANALRLRRS